MILTEQKPHCTILTLNREEKRNALTIEMMDKLCLAIQEAQEKPGQRAIIFKGAGPVFCVGLDLNEIMDEKLHEISQKVGQLLKTIDRSPLVTIAAVHGAALAGGLGILCACDLAIAQTKTIFGAPETRRGLVATRIMPYLMRFIPNRLLRELVLLGETINAERAYEVGLINKIAKNTALSDALQFVDLLIKGAPQATLETKKLLHKLEPLDFDAGERLSDEIYRAIAQSHELKEGIASFYEKRNPQWDQ